LGDELEVLLSTKSENAGKALFCLEPKRCGFCSRRVSSFDELGFLYEKGVCRKCDGVINRYKRADGYQNSYGSVKDFQNL